MSTVASDIAKAKKKLIAQAKKKGISENFGQKEVRDLGDKHRVTLLWYGSPEERREAQKLEEFENWCMNFDSAQLQQS